MSTTTLWDVKPYEKRNTRGRDTYIPRASPPRHRRRFHGVWRGRNQIFRHVLPPPRDRNVEHVRGDTFGSSHPPASLLRPRRQSNGIWAYAGCRGVLVVRPGDMVTKRRIRPSGGGCCGGGGGGERNRKDLITCGRSVTRSRANTR